MQTTHNVYVGMNVMDAWWWIISNWGCTEWKPIPSHVRDVLNLPKGLGVFSFMLITRNSAQAAINMCAAINQRTYER